MDLARENQTALNTPKLEESLEVRNEAKSESLSKVNSAWTWKLDITNKYNDNLIQSKYKMTIFTFGFLILFFNRDGQERLEQ